MDRRSFFRAGAAGIVLLAQPRIAASQERASLPLRTAAPRARPPLVAPGGPIAVTTPNGTTLPLRTVGGVKVGHLVA